MQRHVPVVVVSDRPAAAVLDLTGAIFFIVQSRGWPRSIHFLRQDPLEAILVIFGRRALIFLFVGKNEK